MGVGQQAFVDSQANVDGPNTLCCYSAQSYKGDGTKNSDLVIKVLPNPNF